LSASTIVLAGAGGHARACIDVIEAEGRFAIAGLIGSAGEVGARLLGYEVVGTDAELPKLIAQHSRALIVVGQIKTPAPRVRLYELLRSLGCELPAIVSPRAYVSKHATIGPGTIVMHGAVVNAGAVVGSNCILNSQSLVEHDVVVGDHCHVSTAAVLNGGVRVGAQTFIGSSAHVREGIRIGEGCIVGMGQRVLEDCADGSRIAS
jgi:sugar O-acyltransferase (sialic acid O-acetyltransferase NeuD family)